MSHMMDDLMKTTKNSTSLSGEPGCDPQLMAGAGYTPQRDRGAGNLPRSR